MPETARLLSISRATLKQWIYGGKVRSVRTPGGHHRIPHSEIERLSGMRHLEIDLPDEQAVAAISGRNKLLGTVKRVRRGGVLSEVTIAVGDLSLTAIITAESCRALGLKAGVRVYGLVKATDVMVIKV